MKYIVRSYRDYDDPLLIYGLNVDDVKYEDTGLVDSVGNPIVRMPPPIGFGRDNEWQ